MVRHVPRPLGVVAVYNSIVPEVAPLESSAIDCWKQTN